MYIGCIKPSYIRLTLNSLTRIINHRPVISQLRESPFTQVEGQALDIAKAVLLINSMARLGSLQVCRNTQLPRLLYASFH